MENSPGKKELAGEEMELETGDSLSSLPALPKSPARKHRNRSASAPILSVNSLKALSYLEEEEMGMEAKFLEFGDSVALFSERDRRHGFVSTLG